MSKKFDVDSDLVRKLAELLSETGLGEIEYEESGIRIRVTIPSYQNSPIVTTDIKKPNITIDRVVDNSPPIGAVTAPMVGTIYTASAPGEPPFVNVGDAVLKGQTILVIEAMKTFNEISAHCDGNLSEILVKDGQPVEYGEILALIS
ncbi:MAG: acetyl-CoA carboxylase biotin carboxyl carrier protein [Alphaproteobacteria bacterium]|nr:acetyl-CoA carboxylase biotin carboxyl carrier protein [Alphaproteobacteria bacterium]|tara:strand:- start:178 stop:618 length:441 start_codon:yes stop_codon:yes gene_type:complete